MRKHYGFSNARRNPYAKRLKKRDELACRLLEQASAQASGSCVLTRAACAWFCSSAAPPLGWQPL